MVAYSIKVSEFCQLDSRADTLVSEIKKLLQHILKNNSVSDSDELREGFIKNNIIFYSSWRLVLDLSSVNKALSLIANRKKSFLDSFHNFGKYTVTNFTFFMAFRIRKRHLV